MDGWISYFIYFIYIKKNVLYQIKKIKKMDGWESNVENKKEIKIIIIIFTFINN